MSKAQVALIDYGIGNLFSVRRALETAGADVTVTSESETIESARFVVLPGVGAFSDGMQGLRERNLIDSICRYAATKRPLLGICLGMQMLASVSEEFGEHIGLGLIPGRVLAIPAEDVRGGKHKIPHIGWSALMYAGSGWSATPLANTTQATPVYLVHSYHVVPDDAQHLLAMCDYGGHPITAAIRKENIFGFQFHPEKSGPQGLQMLRTFLGL